MGERERIKPTKRYPASKKERKKVVNISRQFFENIIFNRVEHVEFKDLVIYVVDNIACIVELGEKKFPHLLCLLKKKPTIVLPKVIVDRGATVAVGRGADLMVPGIRRIEGSFGKGSIVVIIDEESGIPVAVGEALMSSEEILERISTIKRGRAIKVIHRPGDKIWRMGEAL